VRIQVTPALAASLIHPIRPSTIAAVIASIATGSEEGKSTRNYSRFLRPGAQTVGQLHKAIVDSNAEAVERTATHSLKGQLSYLGLASVSDKSRDLEQMGRKSELTNASELMGVLETEVSALMAQMRAGSGVKNETLDR
jgi:Hpt domain